MQNALKFDRIRKELPGVFMTLGLVAILTAVLFALVWEVGLAHGSVVFLVPVVIAATRWGVVSAVVAAICGVLASAFFFYEPLYSFRIKDPQEVIDLILFIFVAVAVSQLATRLKWQLEMARQREIDLRDLYAFSRWHSMFPTFMPLSRITLQASCSVTSCCSRARARRRIVADGAPA
jgi:two-component system sensor histidine kinase KdpD